MVKSLNPGLQNPDHNFRSSLAPRPSPLTERVVHFLRPMVSGWCACPEELSLSLTLSLSLSLFLSVGGYHQVSAVHMSRHKWPGILHEISFNVKKTGDEVYCTA